MLRASVKSALIGGVLALIFLSPAQATTFTYVGNGPTDIDISFDTTLTGPALDSLSLTNITGTVSNFTISAAGLPPPEDAAGFPLGVHDLQSFVVGIATNASGMITSWNISGVQFDSYPAVAGENPNDFFCLYNISSTNTLDQVGLRTDNDAGFCPDISSSVENNAGLWNGQSSATVSVPEPLTLSLFGAGILGAAGLRRRKSAKSV